MRFKKIISILSLLFTMSVSAQDVENRLTFDPEYPKAGEPATLIYTPLPSMTGFKTINGVAYTYKNQKWTGHDITLKNEGNVWKGTFTPEPETGFMAFKFIADTIVDNNSGYTFGTMLNKADGRPWPEGYAAWGLLRSERYNHSIPGYIDFTTTPEVSDTIVYYWINNEITYNPSSAVAYAPMFARSATAAGIENAPQRIEKAIEYLLSLGSEEALISAYEITAGTPRADSILNIARSRYPNGLVALKDKYFEEYDYRSPDSVRKHLNGILEQFPYTPRREEYLNKYAQGYDHVYSTLMLIEAMNGNYDAMESYLDNLTYVGCAGIFYKLVTVPHIRKDRTDAELLPFATRIVERMQALRPDKPLNRSYLSEKEWFTEADNSICDWIAQTYSEILKNTGNIDKALQYSRLAQKKAGYQSADVNDNMAELLKASGLNAELKSLLEKSVFYNQVSTMQTDMLRDLYIADHGSTDGFEAYVESLKNPDDKSAIRKEIEKYRCEAPMPQWELTDADGKKVSSSQLKGKVYVIDFWANWCHPCKAALPGMQLAVDHYKGDNNVEFLFIDTQEGTGYDYRQKAKDYLNAKNLDLHLVFDGERDGSDVNDMLSSTIMKQFTISGIPLKIVVDADGNIRFVSMGYKGSPSALRDEMIEMVEQAKQPVSLST